MAEGAYMWMQEGLAMPEKLKEASKAYRNEMDVIEQFIEDECKRVDGGKVKAHELYELYKKWANDNGAYKMSNKDFGQKMKEKFEYKRITSGMFYFGLEIPMKYPGLESL